MPVHRLAEAVSAAAYGSVLVLAALSVVRIAQVELGYGIEIVAGVGAATWIAHLFAELLGGHVREQTPMRRTEVARAVADGLPILIVTVLPACALLLGRVDVVTDDTARWIAIGVALAQLLALGVLVARASPSRPRAVWVFAGATAAVGLLVVSLSVLLKH